MTDFTDDEIREGCRRLENAALAVEQHPEPSKFTMRWCVLDCGTPACVIGAYAARRDLQDEFRISQQHNHWYVACASNEDYLEAAAQHFKISYVQAYNLFSQNGCADAKTPAKAAAFIRAFVSRRASRLGAGE